MLEIISFVQLKFPPSVAIWHNNAISALLPKSLVHLMDPETWKLDLETWLINHPILYSFDVISFKKMLDVEMKGFGDGAGR